MKRLLLLLCIGSVLVAQSLSCSCIAQTLERAYCSATTSFRATILTRFDNCAARRCHAQKDRENGRLTYIANVSQLMKGSMPEDGIAYLETSIDANQCGSNSLLDNEEYLFTLNSQLSDDFRCPSSVFLVSSCEFIQSWHSLSSDAKQFIADNVRTGNKLCGDPFATSEASPTPTP